MSELFRHSHKRVLLHDAEALDNVAAAARYLAGVAESNDPQEVDRIVTEATTIKAWADLCREVAATL